MSIAKMMNEAQGRAELTRSKRFSIKGPHDGLFVGEASLEDNFHSMRVRLLVGAYEMEIVSVEGSIGNAPHPSCGDAVPNLETLVGMRIRPGLFKEMESRVGGPRGCIHMNELIRETCQLVAAHRNFGQLEEMKARGLREEEIQEQAERIRSWTCIANPEAVAGT